MATEAKIISDSISSVGKRITTFVLKYPRYIHSELMTHRAFSKNASSSRAIPMSKIIKQVITDPVIPIHFGANKVGMSANNELTGLRRIVAKYLWLGARWPAALFAYAMKLVGLHKQIGNRILEPWMYIHVVLTGTEFDNFYSLRCDKEHAHPDIYMLAEKMLEAHNNSIPELTKVHLPFVLDEEKVMYDGDTLISISAARCCRISYLNHDNSKPNVQKDIELCNTLKGNGHRSPFEHQAFSLQDKEECSGNFVGWLQYRKTLENENYDNFARLEKAVK